MRTRNNLFRTFREFTSVNGEREITLCAIRQENVKGGTNISIGYSVKRTDDDSQLKKEPGKLPLNRQIALGRASKTPFSTLTVTLTPEESHVFATSMLDRFEQEFKHNLEDYVVSVAGITRKAIRKAYNQNSFDDMLQDMEQAVQNAPADKKDTVIQEMVIQGLNKLNDSVHKILNKTSNERTNSVEH